MLRHRLLPTALFLALLSAPQDSQAVDFYWETGIGASKFNEPTLFGASGSGDINIAFNLVLGLNLSKAFSTIQFHVNAQARVLNSNINGQTLTLMGAYPVLRIETPRLYIGAGATPLLFSRTGDGLGFTPFNMVSGYVGLMAEAGLLWRVVPFFHFSLAAGAQMLMQGGSLASDIYMEATAQTRFYYGGFGSGSSDRREIEFDGWRYPFGIKMD